MTKAKKAPDLLHNGFSVSSTREKEFMLAFSRATLRGGTLSLTKEQKQVFVNYLKRLQASFRTGDAHPPTVPSVQ